MTPADVTSLVERELATFRYDPPPPGSGLLGRPWSAERVARGVEDLRAALVPPRRATLLVRALGASVAERREAWVVAEAAGLVVVFDPAAREFALAEPAEEGALADINVRGDLVGTFLAA